MNMLLRWSRLSLALLAGLVPLGHSAELKLGTAAVTINPPLGIGLAGYYHERGHEGVLDDIGAKATVFDDGQTRAAIVVCDLISMPKWIVVEARKQAYWAVLGGGFGHAYGSPNWHLRDDWRKVAALPGAESLRHLRHLFTVRPFFELEPDVKNTVAVGGQGRYATNDWATTARARDGRFVIAYLPSPRALEIDLSKVAGKQARVTWMDGCGHWRDTFGRHARHPRHKSFFTSGS